MLGEGQRVLVLEEFQGVAPRAPTTSSIASETLETPACRTLPRWYLDKMIYRIGGRRLLLWRVVDNEGELPDVIIQCLRDNEAAVKSPKRLLHNRPVEPQSITTNGLAS